MTGPQRDVALAVSRIRAALTLLGYAHEMAPADFEADRAYNDALLHARDAVWAAMEMRRLLNEADARRATARNDEKKKKRRKKTRGA